MKVRITEDMVRRMTERQENGQTGDIVILTKLIETRQSFWLSIAPGVRKIQDECVEGAL
jgi:hypothetical protein